MKLNRVWESLRKVCGARRVAEGESQERKEPSFTFRLKLLGFQELGDGENDALACVNAVGNWSVHGEKNKPRVVMNVTPRGIEMVKYNNQEGHFSVCSHRFEHITFFYDTPYNPRIFAYVVKEHCKVCVGVKAFKFTCITGAQIHKAVDDAFDYSCLLMSQLSMHIQSTSLQTATGQQPTTFQQNIMTTPPSGPKPPQASQESEQRPLQSVRRHQMQQGPNPSRRTRDTSRKFHDKDQARGTSKPQDGDAQNSQSQTKAQPQVDRRLTDHHINKIAKEVTDAYLRSQGVAA